MKTDFTVRHFHKTSNTYAIFLGSKIIEMGQGTMSDISTVLDDWLGKGTWFLTDRQYDEEYFDVWTRISTV